MSTQLTVKKPIKGYDGLYEVTNLGDVISVERRVKRSRGGTQILRSKILKKNGSPNTYQTVALSKDGKPKTFLVHKLVAEAFLNKVEEHVIDHIDGNKHNNNVSNLRYCTQRENVANKKSGISKYGIGVQKQSKYYKKPYRVRIYVNGKNTEVGSYYTIHEAQQAYKKAKQTLNTK